MEVKVVENVLKWNDALARANRARFDAAGLMAVNFIGSPGSGKTTLLERTVAQLAPQVRLGCIEGDPYTTKDAERIGRLGVPTVQINTKGGCHLDANLVATALDDMALPDLHLLLIENVGNLMCPSQYDLGEHLTVVVLSVAEGADKPDKYPAAFQRSAAVVINKTDLLPFTDVALPQVETAIRRYNPGSAIFPVSARTGEGLGAWSQWLEQRLTIHRSAR